MLHRLVRGQDREVGSLHHSQLLCASREAASEGCHPPIQDYEPTSCLAVGMDLIMDRVEKGLEVIVSGVLVKSFYCIKKEGTEAKGFST